MGLLLTQQTVKYFRVASAAIWAFDYSLTLEQEAHLFGSVGRWNIGTVMFIAARYSPIAWIVAELYMTLGSQSVETCLKAYWASGTAIFLIFVATEGLLLIRTLALWHDNRKIKRILLVAYMLVICLTVICIILGSSPLKSVGRLMMAEFVGSALFELTATIVTLYHSMRLGSTGIHTVSRLASALRKGSLLYALSLFAISVANVAFLSLPVSDGKNGMLDVFQGALHGVMASRILFDLRAQAVELDEEHSGNIQSPSYRFPSELRFAPRNDTMTVSHDERNA